MHRSVTAIIFVAGFSVACAPSGFLVGVDAISHGQTTATSYVLLPGNKDTTAGDLHFKEYARYVRRALGLRGYREAVPGDTAQIAVFLSYGVGDPTTHQYSYVVPEYLWSGGVTRTTRGTVESQGKVKTFTSTTITYPHYVYGGYQSQSGSYVTYTHFMALVAYDFAAKLKRNEDVQLWKTSASSTGESSDLRTVFPYLVAAAVPHLGGDTKREIRNAIPDDNPDLQHIRGGLEPAPPAR